MGGAVVCRPARLRAAAAGASAPEWLVVPCGPCPASCGARLARPRRGAAAPPARGAWLPPHPSSATRCRPHVILCPRRAPARRARRVIAQPAGHNDLARARGHVECARACAQGLPALSPLGPANRLDRRAKGPVAAARPGLLGRSPACRALRLNSGWRPRQVRERGPEGPT